MSGRSVHAVSGLPVSGFYRKNGERRTELIEQKRNSLLIDYRYEGEVIELQVRRAVIGYVLQRLSVDTSKDHNMNPDAHQLVVLNREEIEPFAAWAFH